MAWYPSLKSEVPPITIVEWANGTDEEIAAMLEAHYAGQIDITEIWTVGDERVVSLSAMSATGVSESHAAQNVTLVLSEVGGKYLSDGVTECAFQVDQKNSLDEFGEISDDGNFSGGWKICERRTWCNSIYKNAFPVTLQPIFKEFINQSGTGGGSSSGVENTSDYFALRAEVEIFGSCTYSVSGEGSQVNYYETSTNRIKQRQLQNKQWHERSPQKNYTKRFCYVDATGVGVAGVAGNRYGIAPFGVI